MHHCRLPPVYAAHFTNATPVSIVPYIVTLPPEVPKADGPPCWAHAPHSHAARIAATHAFIATSLASLHKFSILDRRASTRTTAAAVSENCTRNSIDRRNIEYFRRLEQAVQRTGPTERGAAHLGMRDFQTKQALRARKAAQQSLTSLVTVANSGLTKRHALIQAAPLQ
jgi:hypothetical protein